MNELNPTFKGNNNDNIYSSSMDPLVDVFSKVGNFSSEENYYDNLEDTLDLFKKGWEVSPYLTMQIAFWMRDCRGGAGNRKDFRRFISSIAQTHPKWIESNLHLIPYVGRWDDLMSLVGTEVESKALEYWATAILKGDGLACKWSPREKRDKKTFKKLRKFTKMSPPEFRKHVASFTNVIETSMCAQEWDKIDYNRVPSVAMSKMNFLFLSKDRNRFQVWKQSLTDENSSNKINASVLFPHDCVMTLNKEMANNRVNRFSLTESSFFNSEIANAQFEALPNFMEENEMRIMPICDFSGSMTQSINEKCSTTLLDVCMGLGLYCSDRVGKDNPFYRKIIPFSNDAKLVAWKDLTFSEACQKLNDGFVGSTNILSALDQILSSAILLNANYNQMPNCLLILSDMQWDSQVDGSGTAVEEGMKKWEEAGYKRPTIVYWNLNQYEGSPSTVEHSNVAMVSGYSPSLLKTVCSGGDVSPIGIMLRTIEKYEVVTPLEK